MWWYFSMSILVTRCHACLGLWWTGSIFSIITFTWKVNLQNKGIWVDKFAPLCTCSRGKQPLCNKPSLYKITWSMRDLVRRSLVWYVNKSLWGILVIKSFLVIKCSSSLLCALFLVKSVFQSPTSKTSWCSFSLIKDSKLFRVVSIITQINGCSHCNQIQTLSQWV